MIVELTRDMSPDMPLVGGVTQVEALRIWHCGYRSLSSVSSYINLRTLLVATYPDADLDAVAALEQLEYLSLLHIPLVSDLRPLARLRRLRTLRLATLPSWDSGGKVTTVVSLRPLADLPRLEHLELFGVRPADESLGELEAAPNLATVRVSKYPEAEVRRFYAATGTRDDWAPAPDVIGDHGPW
ncbi:MAG: hypothetical protein QOG52_9 [Frankiaceae bacterium]|jgi:hypothetical protein|nr:hypothetical protein [Frankiaceae bacterium]